MVTSPSIITGEEKKMSADERNVEEKLNDVNQAGPMRQKYWSELGIEEKIERIREQVWLLIHKVDNMNDVVSMLQQHTHQDGVMVIPMNAPIGGGMGRVGRARQVNRWEKDDDVYF